MVRPRRPVDDFHEDDAAAPPWIEKDRARSAPPRPEAGETLISWRALIIGALVVVALAVALIIGVRSLVGDRASGGEETALGVDGDLIRAPEGPYKVRPETPGGATLEGIDQTLYGTGDGIETEGVIAEGGEPEAPIRPGPPPRDLLPADALPGDVVDLTPAAEAGEPEPANGAPAPAAQPAPVPAPPPAPAAAKPKPVPVVASPAPKPAPATATTAQEPTAATGTVQLGAFSSPEKAEAAWARAVARVPELGTATRRISPVERDGATLHRLRATVPVGRSADICAKLEAAGETCVVIR